MKKSIFLALIVIPFLSMAQVPDTVWTELNLDPLSGNMSNAAELANGNAIRL